jgi:anaphase-promoting complex subunit 5
MLVSDSVHLQFYLDLPKQAVNLIEKVMVTILSHGSLYDQARTLYLWIRCHLAAESKRGLQQKRDGYILV